MSRLIPVAGRLPHRYVASLRWLLPLALGLIATLPLLLRGPSCGHDFDFHLQSWLAVHAAWHGGLLAPHWVPDTNYGAGEPRFVFYPPLSWLLGAGLGAVLPWAYVPAAFTGLCFAGAAATMRQLASRFCLPAPAALAAVLYALSPYLLFTAYERTAYGELLAAVWMPLLLAALLAPRLPLARVALLVAALWYTNAPAAVMGCYLVMLAVLWNATAKGFGFTTARVGSMIGSPVQKQLPWFFPARASATKPAFAPATPLAAGTEFLKGVGALLLGCALAADYLLPAWYEQRFVTIERAVGSGMRIEDSFLFGHTGEPFHDQVLHTASSIAVATLAAGLASTVALVLRWRGERAFVLRQATTEQIPSTANVASSYVAGSAPGQRKHVMLLLVSLLAGCGLMQLRWSDPLWHLMPELAFLQFPWRLLLPGSVAVGLLISCAVRPQRSSRWQFTILGTALLYAACLITWAGESCYQPCDEEDKVSAQLALLASGAGFEGTDEYAAAGSDNGEIQRGLPLVRLLRSPDAGEGDDSGSDSVASHGSSASSSLDANSASTAEASESDGAANPPWKPDAGSAVPGTVQIAEWKPEKLALRLRSQADAYAVLRLERFPAWQVRLDGQPCGRACVLRDDGLLTVHLAANRWSTIEARYRTTNDVLAGRAVSCSALLLVLLPGAVRRARKQRAPCKQEPAQL